MHSFFWNGIGMVQTKWKNKQLEKTFKVEKNGRFTVCFVFDWNRWWWFWKFEI